MRHRPIKISLVTAAAATLTLITGASAGAATAPVSNPQIRAAFDFSKGQTAEAVAIEPSGKADVSLAEANEVVQVAPDGAVTPFPALPSGGTCPVAGTTSTVGIAYNRGSVYVVECSGDAHTGVWRLRHGAPPEQIAQLPASGFPNDMAIDPSTGVLYVADSVLGEVFAVPTRHGAGSGLGSAMVWAVGSALQRTSFIGANGVDVHNGAVWVSNTDQATILRIPIQADGTAGPIGTAVTGLDGGIDNFTVVGADDTIIATQTLTDEVEIIKGGAAPQVVLTAADGLSNPTDAKVHNGKLYVTSGGFVHLGGSNLLVADIALP